MSIYSFQFSIALVRKSKLIIPKLKIFHYMISWSNFSAKMYRRTSILKKSDGVAALIKYYHYSCIILLLGAGLMIFIFLENCFLLASEFCMNNTFVHIIFAVGCTFVLGLNLLFMAFFVDTGALAANSVNRWLRYFRFPFFLET